jgi:hemoglobin-like flavoprotein
MDHAPAPEPGDAAALVVQSLELAAARCPDLTAPVYERLFRTHPETRGMFRAEARDLVKGSMLQTALEALLDFVGAREGSYRMIACEVLNHDGYGTPPELFRAFFAVIAATLKDIVGDAWTPAIDAAWRATLDELDRLIDGALAPVPEAAGRGEG